MKHSPFRKIVRKTWRKTRFRELSAQSQLLLLYLWTGSEAINPGIYYIGVPTIVDDVPLSEKSVRKALRTLAEDEWFRYDPRARVIFFPKWFEYDRPRNESVVSSYLHHLSELPDSDLKKEFLETLLPYMGEFGVSLPENLSHLCEHKPESVPAQAEHNSQSVRATLSSEHLAVSKKAVRPLSSLPDQELDNQNSDHRGEILHRVLEYFNERVTKIGQSTLRLDIASLGNDLREKIYNAIRGRPLSDLKKAVNGCLSQKWNREKGSRMRLSVIFKDIDTLNGHIANSETPEIDDSGNEIALATEHHGIY